MLICYILFYLQRIVSEEVETAGEGRGISGGECLQGKESVRRHRQGLESCSSASTDAKTCD
jgi:hypothetical protein